MFTKGYAYLLSDASASGYVPSDRLDCYFVRRITEIGFRVPMVTKILYIWRSNFSLRLTARDIYLALSRDVM